jgi:ABC-type Fe3+-hydroxamate transport system substrate-binding protein
VRKKDVYLEWIGILGKVKGKESQRKRLINKRTPGARKYVSI